MATQLKLRRDSTADCNGATPAEGEVVYEITKKRLRVGDGATLGGIFIPNQFDVQDQSFITATVSGTNTLTASLTPVLLAYTAGLRLRLKIAANNTTAVTLNVDTVGAKDVKKIVDGAKADLEADDLVADLYYDFDYDGTHFVVGGASLGGGGAETWTKTSLGTGSSVEVALPAGYDGIEFMIAGLDLSTNTTLAMQFYDAGGAAYVTSGYHLQYDYVQSGTAGGGDSTSGSSILLVPSGGATYPAQVHGHIFSYEGNSVRTHMQYQSHGEGSLRRMENGSGVEGTAHDVSKFKLLTGAGTIAGGDIWTKGIKDGG